MKVEFILLPAEWRGQKGKEQRKHAPLSKIIYTPAGASSHPPNAAQILRREREKHVAIHLPSLGWMQQRQVYGYTSRLSCTQRVCSHQQCAVCALQQWELSLIIITPEIMTRAARRCICVLADWNLFCTEPARARAPQSKLMHYLWMRELVRARRPES
jgi:hypothetical protein